MKTIEAEKILILSGEGETGSFKIYTGKRTERALKTKLTKERPVNSNLIPLLSPLIESVLGVAS